jgi:hypothetical protein
MFHFLFIYVENSKGIPVPVKKTEGTGIPRRNWMHYMGSTYLRPTH